MITSPICNWVEYLELGIFMPASKIDFKFIFQYRLYFLITFQMLQHFYFIVMVSTTFSYLYFAHSIKVFDFMNISPTEYSWTLMPFDQLSVCDSEAISSLYQLYPWLTSRHKINHKLSLIGPSHDEHKSLEEPQSTGC